jgi:UDP:flavonoid glycosyltransferase YjiC (YdhE family)
MKIVLATCGSRGDVQPMLALALGLQSRGHTVLLAGPPERKGWAEQLGCPYFPLGDDVTGFIDEISCAQELRSAVEFISFVRRGVADQFARLPAIIHGADLVVGSALNFALASLAESMGIAYRYIAFAPHLHLFPRMAAIIHHGGAGTTAAAAISGRPQIIVPHVLDQYYWGRQIHRAGLGPKAIYRSRLKTANLAAAIDTCLSDASFRQTAVSTAATIRKTDGVASTIAELLKQTATVGS